MYKGKPVTFAILSCRRTHLLPDVLRLFRQNCRDAGLVDRWLLIDDSHDPVHHAALAHCAGFEVILKTPEAKGHARSLNMLRERCRDGYLVYWEDDAVLAVEGPRISRAIDILESNPDLLQVTFDQDLFTAPWHQDHPAQGQVAEPVPHRIFIPTPGKGFVDPEDFVYYVDRWPGFTLRPHLLDLTRFHRRVGLDFDETLRQNFEYAMALAVHAAGLKVAALSDCDICDVGADCSAYAANGEPRRFETAGGLYSAGHLQDIRDSCAARSGAAGGAAHFRLAQRWMQTDAARQAVMADKARTLMRAGKVAQPADLP